MTPLPGTVLAGHVPRVPDKTAGSAVVRNNGGPQPQPRVVLAQYTPDLPPQQRLPGDPRVTPPEPRGGRSAVGPQSRTDERLPPGSTPTARVEELARLTVDRLRAGDRRGALDAVHGQRGRVGDDQFQERFMTALRREAASRSGGVGADAMLSTMSVAERALFNAYLRNPGGVSQPEDIAFISMQGTGTGTRAINDIYADLRARYPDQDGNAYRQAVRAVDERFLATYGRARGNPESLEADLTRGFWSELGGDDRREYRAARIQSPDAMEVYRAGDSRTFSFANGEVILDRIAANAHRLDEFAAQYGYVADGREGQGRERLEQLVRDNLRGPQAERARALLGQGTPQERSARYAQLTLRGYLDGSVSRDDTVRAIRTLTAQGAPLAGGEFASRVDQDLQRAVVQRGRDGEVRAAITELSYNNSPTSGTAAVAEFERRFTERGGLPDLRNFARYLDALSPDQRRAILAANPNIEQRINERYHPPEIRERILRAVRGETDAVDLLRYRQQSLAEDNDVVNATLALGFADRASLREVFESRYRGQRPSPSYDDAIGSLGSEARAQMRLATAVPRGPERAQLDRMISDMRDVFARERGDAGWAALSRRWTDTFAFSGPVVDDALREVVNAARRAGTANTAGRLDESHIDALVNAQTRLQRALGTYTADRSDVANNTADAALLIVSVATLGAGLTPMAMTRAVAGAALANPLVHGAVEGPNYTAGQAMYHFFSGAALEVGGIGVGAVGHRALRAGVSVLRR
ncbi:MAG: hypothetical protein ACAI38_17095 [Myxococcota bacterium]